MQALCERFRGFRGYGFRGLRFTGCRGLGVVGVCGYHMRALSYFNVPDVVVQCSPRSNFERPGQVQERTLYVIPSPNKNLTNVVRYDMMVLYWYCILGFAHHSLGGGRSTIRNRTVRESGP